MKSLSIFFSCSKLEINLKEIQMKYKAVIYVTVGKWICQPDKNHFKPEVTTFHGKSYIIPHAYISTIKKYKYGLEYIVLFKIRKTDSKWVATCFIHPKKSCTIRFITDYRDLDKNSKKLFPHTKHSSFFGFR